MEDFQLEEELSGMDEKQERAAIKQHLLASWAHHKKGAWVKMCRFANWVDRAAEYDGQWSWTVLRLLHYALTENFLDGCGLQALFKPNDRFVQAGGGDGGEDRTEVSRSNEVVERFRNALKSNTQLSLAMLLEPQSRWKARVLYVFVAPIRRWYGLQSCRIRSCPAMLGFLIEQIGQGEINKPYKETLELFSDAAVLQKIGLQTDFLPHDAKKDPHHPSIAEQDEICSVVVNYTFSLICSRFRRLQYLTHGWAGRQVEFISEHTRRRALQDLAAQQEAFRAAGTKTLPSGGSFRIAPTSTQCRCSS